MTDKSDRSHFSHSESQGEICKDLNDEMVLKSEDILKLVSDFCSL